MARVTHFSGSSPLLPFCFFFWCSFHWLHSWSDHLREYQLLFRSSQQVGKSVTSTSVQFHRLEKLQSVSGIVATKLHKHPLLQGSVVLVLDSTSDGSYEGLVLNKSMPFSIEDVPHVQPEVVSLAGLSCSTFVAGPLMPHSCKPDIHMLTSSSCLRGYKKVSRGVYLGDENSVSSTLESVRRGYVKPEEVRLLVNKMVWEKKQLEVEMRSLSWWKIVSCSSNAWIKAPVSQLWISLHGLLERTNS